MGKKGRLEGGKTRGREDGKGGRGEERVVDCLNHGLNGLRRFHGLNDVFDGRDLEKISIALTVRSVDLLPRRVCGGEKQEFLSRSLFSRLMVAIRRSLLPMRVCGEDRRMAAGFANPAGAVLGLGSGWKPDVTRGWRIVVVCGSEVSVGKERAREQDLYRSRTGEGTSPLRHRWAGG